MSKWLLNESSHRSETGEYLALDLGGTNFRVLLITLKDGRMVDQVHFDFSFSTFLSMDYLQLISYYEVAEELRRGPGKNLFRFLAECILVRVELGCCDHIFIPGLSNRAQTTTLSAV